MLPHLYKTISLRNRLRSLSENLTKPDIRAAKILFVEDQLSAKKLLLRTLFLFFNQHIKEEQVKEEQDLWEKANVTWVTKGSSAIDAFNELGHTHFDCIILDNQLEDKISGLDVALHIRQNGYRGPIIMITSSSPESLSTILELQYAKPNDTNSYDIAPVTAQPPYIETRYPAYFSSKPINKENLRCILKQNFTFPQDSHEAVAEGSTPNPVWTTLNHAISTSKNKETDMLDETECLLQLWIFQDYLRTHFSDFLTERIHVDIDHGHIPKEGATRHIMSSTLNTLLSIVPDTLDTSDAEADHTWVNQTYSIIQDMLRYMDISKQVGFQGIPDNQGA